MKILAKRKRGNKFPIQGNGNFGQEGSREKQKKEETNPRIYFVCLGRVPHRGKEEIGS